MCTALHQDFHRSLPQDSFRLASTIVYCSFQCEDYALGVGGSVEFKALASAFLCCLKQLSSLSREALQSAVRKLRQP